MASALAGIQRHPLRNAMRDDYLSAGRGDRFAKPLRHLRTYPAELPVRRDLLQQIATPM